jgi:hypothetical protein
MGHPPYRSTITYTTHLLAHLLAQFSHSSSSDVEVLFVLGVFSHVLVYGIRTDKLFALFLLTKQQQIV